jgi:predicted nucleotidyltransferase
LWENEQAGPALEGGMPDFVLSFVSKQRLPMSASTATDRAERVIRALWAHEGELRSAPESAVSLFGSFARGDTEAASDIDLAVEFYPAAPMDLFRLTALERRITEIRGRTNDALRG